MTTSALVALCIYAFTPYEAADPARALLVRVVCGVALVIYFAAVLRRLYGALFTIFVACGLWLTATALISFSLRYIVAILGIILGYTLAAAVSSSREMRDTVRLLIASVLYISVGVFAVQQAVYIFSGIVIDFHTLLFPSPATRFGGLSGYSRLGGIYIEPGTYANWLYGFFLLLTLLRERIDIIESVTVGASSVLSLSAWGAAVGVLVTAVGTAAAARHRAIAWAVAGVVVSVVFLYLTTDMVSYILEKLQFVGPSGSARAQVYGEFLDALPGLLFFGQGFRPAFCEGCRSPQDAGLVLNMIVVYGLMFTAFVFSVILVGAYRVGGWRHSVLALPLFITKMYYWDFLVWAIFFTAVAIIWGRPRLESDSKLMVSEPVVG